MPAEIDDLKTEMDALKASLDVALTNHLMSRGAVEAIQAEHDRVVAESEAKTQALLDARQAAADMRAKVEQANQGA